MADVVVFETAQVSARIVMREVPVFGDRSGGLTVSPWSDASNWKSGLGGLGFTGMAPIAVAATHAFFNAAWGVGSEPSRLGCRYVHATTYENILNAPDFETSLKKILSVAYEALIEIKGRQGHSTNEWAHGLLEMVNSGLCNFGMFLAAYLGTTEDEIKSFDSVISENVDTVLGMRQGVGYILPSSH